MLSVLVRNKCIYKHGVHRDSILLTHRLLSSKTAFKVSDEYQYIQRSDVPTFHFQASLPRLPIPQLEESCQRYLNAQRPLLSDEQFDKTSLYVSAFLKGPGPELQKQLVRLDAKNRHTSYISEPWFDMYLRDRKPLPINYNPFIVFVPESEPRYNIQLIKATNLTVSAMRFMKSLKAGILKPEVYHMSPKSDTRMFYTVTKMLPSKVSWYGAYLFKAFPLDMSQYSNLFNTTRIPQLVKDKIYHADSARHIVVLYKGHLYSFNVLDENDNIISAKEVAARLKSVLEDKRSFNEHSVGIFTTIERDQWANVRSHLESLGNKDILHKIDSAAFMLILDDDIIGDDYNKLIKSYLYGNCANRWFDKSFSLIISGDGYAGINFEHSWGDGVAVLRFLNDVKQDITNKPRFLPSELDSLQDDPASVEKLNFLLDGKTQSAIAQEKGKYQEWSERLCIDHLIYEGFGKEECKKLRVSPDAIMQLAFQLALFKQEGRVVPTYESCSTAAFKHGRTETIRSCTVQTKAVCSAFVQKNSHVLLPTLKKMIIDCSDAHNTLTKEAAMGKGFDRHLFALKRLCEQAGDRMPDIFDDPAYKNLNHNILSTSTLSSPAVLAGGFGPVELDGYGIGYMIQDKRLGAVVTSYRDCRSATDYVKSLESAFNDIHKVLTHR